MLEINDRRKMSFVRLKDIYYADRINHEHPKCDLVYYFYCREPYRMAKEFKTLLVDLTPEPENILRSFRKKTRAEINKALTSDLFKFEVNEYPGSRELEMFCRGYDQFSAWKNILQCNRDYLKKLQAAGKLIVASASAGDELLCQFALIDAGERMVCFHGYNTRFLQPGDSGRTKLVSQANRALEYHCMIHAKNRGKKNYDLCGVTLDPSDSGTGNVDLYKLGFRGRLETGYTFMYPLTLKGRLFCLIKQLSGGI